MKPPQQNLGVAGNYLCPNGICCNGQQRLGTAMRMMNGPEFWRTKWEHLKCATKMIWVDLSDEDFRRANGARDRLFAIIEGRFGDPPEVIASKIDRYAPPEPLGAVKRFAFSTDSTARRHCVMCQGTIELSPGDRVISRSTYQRNAGDY